MVGVAREAEGEARAVGPYTEARNRFWGTTYHVRLKGGGSKEQARRHACWETLKIYGTTPFAKTGDPQP